VVAPQPLDSGSTGPLPPDSGPCPGRVQEKNRRHAEDAVSDVTPAIRESIERHIAVINEESETLTQKALEIVRADSSLSPELDP
jgi:hypothetical protein